LGHDGAGGVGVLNLLERDVFALRELHDVLQRALAAACNDDTIRTFTRSTILILPQESISAMSPV
jgi:hypothetical protein